MARVLLFFDVGCGCLRSRGHVGIALEERAMVKFILRKEVIQPQVPLRLPCYDLVPIKGLAFGSLR